MGSQNVWPQRPRPYGGVAWWKKKKKKKKEKEKHLFAVINVT